MFRQPLKAYISDVREFIPFFKSSGLAKSSRGIKNVELSWPGFGALAPAKVKKLTINRKISSCGLFKYLLRNSKIEIVRRDSVAQNRKNTCPLFVG